MPIEVARFQVDPRSIVGVAEFAGAGEEDNPEYLKGVFFERVRDGLSSRIALVATNGHVLARFEDATEQGDFIWLAEDGYYVPTARIVPLLTVGLKSQFPSPDLSTRRDPVTISITEEPAARIDDPPIVRVTLSFRGIVYTETVTGADRFPDYTATVKSATAAEAVESIALDAKYVGMFEGAANKIRGGAKVRNYIQASFAGPDKAVSVRMRILDGEDFLAFIMPARQESLGFSVPEKKAVNE